MPSEDRPWRIWVLSDGNPGHYNQSAGLGKMLGRHVAVQTEWVPADLRLRGFLRPAFKLLLNRTRRPLPEPLLRLSHQLPTLPAGTPDVILSSGGQTAFLNICLQRVYQCRNVYNGRLKGLDARHFTTVVSYDPVPEADKSLVLDLLPTAIHPDELEAAGEELRETAGLGEERLWTLLIGGNSRSHRYSHDDWRQLATGLRQLARRYGVRWLLTTSRRTGEAAEKILRDHLTDDVLAQAVWYSREPRRVIPAFLGAGEVIFCTRDSQTMLNEAMASAKPVYGIFPEGSSGNMRSGQPFSNYLQRHIWAGRIKQVPLATLADIDVQADCCNDFRPIARQVFDKVAEELLERLKPARPFRAEQTALRRKAS